MPPLLLCFASNRFAAENVTRVLKTGNLSLPLDRDRESLLRNNVVIQWLNGVSFKSLL